MAHNTLSQFAAGAASLMMVTAAFAGEAGAARSARVGYADLNLASDTGVDRLYARLRKASNEVCGTAAFNRVGAGPDHDCATKALDDAVKAVDNDKLTLLHGGAVPVAGVAAISR